MTDLKELVATCRGCGRALNGKPYYMGGDAFHPVTGERCPISYYGGYVCSEDCDRRSLYEMESIFPRAGKAHILSTPAAQRLASNWIGGKTR